MENLQKKSQQKKKIKRHFPILIKHFSHLILYKIVFEAIKTNIYIQ